MTDDIGLSGSDRLERMERLLERIDGKLESKVDKADFTALELRVRDMELHGSPGLQATEHNLHELRRQALLDASASRTQIESLQRKMAYATGIIAAFIFVVNILTGHSLGHF